MPAKSALPRVGGVRVKHFSRILVCVASLTSAAACSSPGTVEDLGGFEAVSQPLLWGPGPMLSNPAYRYSESAAATSGIYSIVSSNKVDNVTGGVVPSSWDYRCFNNGVDQGTFALGVSNESGDPHADGQGGWIYRSSLGVNYSDTRVFRSSAPCNTVGGSGTWFGCTFTPGYDQPRIVHVAQTGTTDVSVWITGDDTSQLFTTMSISRLDFCSTVSTFAYKAQCNTQQVITNPRGVRVGNVIHVVFVNKSVNQLQYTTFNTFTNQWNCSPQAVASLFSPSTVCTANDVYPAFGTLGANGTSRTLEWTYDPEIVATSTGTLIAAVSSQDVNQGSRIRAFRRPSNSGTWSQTLLMAGESAHPSLAVSGTTVRLGAQYNSSGNKSAMTDWTSANDGQTWAGSYIEAERVAAPSTASFRPCYWGDYDASVYISGGLLHTWSVKPVGTTPGQVWGRVLQ